MNILNKACLILTFMGCISAGAAEPAVGKLRAARFFSDHMVLQRDKPQRIHGFAPSGASVSVSFAGQQKTATADANGQWTVTLDPMPVQTQAQTMTLKAGTESVVINDILVGDLVLFARQTSMDVTLGANKALRETAEKAKPNPWLRAVSINTIPAMEPQADLAPESTDGWKSVDAASAMKMSAAAYLLGADLATQQVPVGMIDLNMGTQFPIAWLSRESLLDTDKFYEKSDVVGVVKRFDEMAECLRAGKPLPARESIRSNPERYALCPAAGYNAVLNPLRGLALKTVLLQLGNDYPYMIYAELDRTGKRFDREALNEAYVNTYDIRKVGFRMAPVTTPRIPLEWRNLFGDRELPIGLILPPGSDLETEGQHLREMRELHRLTAIDNARVGVILPGSENVPLSAEPKDEALLAARCLSWVRGAVYQQAEVPATGPLFDRLETNFNKATIHFATGTARGLKAATGALDYFEVAGTEGEYEPVKAKVDGETIRITSDTVSRITRVRYNWNARPNQGLVNAAGLPAIPFRSEKAPYHWFVKNEDNDLPMEYHTPANEWTKNDVTLVNGQLKTHGYDNFTGWLGPIGIWTGPFGPNMGVRKVSPGSPADGKLLVGDVIYSVNGKLLGYKAWETMGAGITESETEEANGKMVLGVRRDSKNLNVELTLKVMGTYSSTSPYDCPKTEKIINQLEEWVAAKDGDAGFLNGDALFLMAAGNPKYQGLVRRAIYARMKNINPAEPINPGKAGQSWYNAADAFLFGEYYLATGDRNVLPYLQNFCDRLAATQNPLGGWRHNFPGGATYGLIPNAGLPGVMGMYFGMQAGLPINQKCYDLAMKHFTHNRAETGCQIYGFGDCERPIPPPLDPALMATGSLWTYNGGLSASAILMKMVGNHRAAHLCSLMSVYSWNNTFEGHGGNYWNNFWSPLGAYTHSRPAFIHFWKNYRWYRECNRMFDGSLIQHEDGRVGAATGLVLVAPRQRLQIVGAPRSPFAADAPELLKPALTAYHAKNYAECEKLTTDLLATGSITKDIRPTVEFLGRAARELQASIAADISRVEELVKQGQFYKASMEMPQLWGVLPSGNTRLTAIEQALAASGADEKLRQQKIEQEALVEKAKVDAKNEGTTESPRNWECLTTEISTKLSKASGPGKVAPEQASQWRMQIVENMVQAPTDWNKPGFDDSAWNQTQLPVSWRMYHTALLRTKFTVSDKNAFDGLRFRAWLFRQQAIEIYLNGQLIGKVNNLEEKTGNVDADFNDSAMKHLKTGENTLAITTRHNWRWGMLSMHVYNDGFGFRLDARKK